MQWAVVSIPLPSIGIAEESLSYSDAAIADKWMHGWMESTRAAQGTLHVMRFSDGMYCLTRKIGWSPNDNKKNLPAVDVPLGFVTDFASIPRVFWSALPRDGSYTYAAIIHDFLYWTQATTREAADDVFYEAMLDFKVNPIAREAIFTAVRLAGGSAWDQNRKLKASGEKRLLKLLPADPTISWETWKVDAENF
jgi:hypothetical protein